VASDQLSIYNQALYLLGERSLASLTENREPRRILDVVWRGAVKFCLEEGQWKFALRTSKLTYSADVVPAFGYRRAFERPSDCVRLSKVCSDEYLKTPLLEYNEEAGWWFADVDDIYVSYVSDGLDFGNDYANWPETFATYVSIYVATQSGLRICQSERTMEKLEKDLKKAKRDALSKDALQGSTQFLPQGSWVSARRAGGRSRYDRGSRSTLIG
jgi:hypothetical protein